MEAGGALHVVVFGGQKGEDGVSAAQETPVHFTTNLCVQAPLFEMRAPLLATLAAGAAGAALPHLVAIFVDDFGRNNVGFHARNQPNALEVVTPVMDELASDGIILDRLYNFKFCSPSRSSFLTGRNPIHVNVVNSPLGLFNQSDPISGFSGIPRNMSTIAEKLASVGYSTVQSGKVRRVFVRQRAGPP